MSSIIESGSTKSDKLSNPTYNWWIDTCHCCQIKHTSSACLTCGTTDSAELISIYSTTVLIFFTITSLSSTFSKCWSLSNNRVFWYNRNPSSSFLRLDPTYLCLRRKHISARSLISFNMISLKWDGVSECLPSRRQVARVNSRGMPVYPVGIDKGADVSGGKTDGDCGQPLGNVFF